MPNTAETTAHVSTYTAAAPNHRDDETTVLALALATSQTLRALIGLKLAPLGLASGQDRLLGALEQHGPLSVSKLADELNVRPSTVSKMMDRLAARGYTRRVPDDLDARRINVELTRDGYAVCKNLRVLYTAIEAELQSEMSEDETRRMLAGLTILNETVGKRLRRLR